MARYRADLVTAVSRGDVVLDKQTYRVRPTFDANNDRLRLTGEDIELRLPVTPERTAAAYTISAGFELSPPEVEANRRRR